MHFCIAVIHKANQSVDTLLSRYDENIDLEYIKTKEEHIKDVRENIKLYNERYYKKYIDDPEGYISSIKDYPERINYILNIFPKQLKWTDEECYQEAIKYYDDEDVNPDGSTIEYGNPDGKWDWYEIGGRFSKLLITKSGNAVNTCKIAELDKNKLFDTYAYVLNGIWYEEDDKKKSLPELLTELDENLLVTIVDIHS